MHTRSLYQGKQPFNASLKSPSPSKYNNLSHIYSRYSRSHRNAQWIPRQNHSYAYQSVDNNVNGLYFDDRDQLYLRLQQQKLNNQRSHLIIQDLLDQNRKKKQLMQDIINSNKQKQELIKDKKYASEKYYVKSYSQYNKKAKKNDQKYQNKDRDKDRNIDIRTKIKQQNYHKIKKIQQKTKNKTEISSKNLNLSISPDTIKYTYQSTKNKMSPKNKSPKQQTSAKQKILKKLFAQTSPYSKQLQTQIIKTQNDDTIFQLQQKQRLKQKQKCIQTQKQQQIKNREILQLKTDNLIYKQQIKFLKQQLNQKNQTIIQIQLQVIRLQKGQKMLTDLIAQMTQKSSKSPKKDKNICQNCSKSSISSKNSSFIYEQNINQQKWHNFRRQKCLNIQIQSQFNSTVKQIKNIQIVQNSAQQQYNQTSLQLSQSNKINQNNAQNDEIKEQKIKAPPVLQKFPTKILKMDSNILTWSMEMSSSNQQQKMRQSPKPRLMQQSGLYQIQFNLSISQPINNPNTKQQMRQNKILEQQSYNLDDFTVLAKQISTKSIQENKIEQYTQTQIQINQVKIQNVQKPENKQAVHDKQVQTSQNYYDYIQGAYLDWIYEKDYKQIQQRKKKQIIKTQANSTEPNQ